MFIFSFLHIVYISVPAGPNQGQDPLSTSWGLFVQNTITVTQAETSKTFFCAKKKKIDVVSFDYQMVVKTKVLLPSKMRTLISPTDNFENSSR